MGKDLFEYFTERFEANLARCDRFKEAFHKTNEEIGFDAYKNYRSYSVTRKKRKK